MKFMKIAVAVAACAGMLVGTAHAVSVVGTGSITGVQVTGSPAGTIGVGTEFTFTFSSWAGGLQGFLPIPVTFPIPSVSVSTSKIKATVNSDVSFSGDFGSFMGKVEAATAGGDVNNKNVVIYAVGDFTPSGLLNGFDMDRMSLTFTANQTGGPTGQISASYTIASPPAPFQQVPEPGALALVGIALAGLTLVRRKAA